MSADRTQVAELRPCDPALAEMLRAQYTGVGHRSHLDKRFWIAVDLDADVPSKEIKRLVEHSYELCVPA